MLAAAEFKELALKNIKQQSQSDNDYEYIHHEDLINILYDAYQIGYVDGRKNPYKKSE